MLPFYKPRELFLCFICRRNNADACEQSLGHGAAADFNQSADYFAEAEQLICVFPLRLQRQVQHQGRETKSGTQ